MDYKSSHPLQRYWDLALCSVKADALRTALELDLFTALTQPASAAAVAQRLDLDPANTGHLLELLWSMELVTRVRTSRGAATPWMYRSADVARRYLVKDAPEYCAGAWAFRLSSLRRFGQHLGDHLHREPTGTGDAPATANASAWAAAAQAQIGQEQYAVTARAAVSVLERAGELRDAQRFLDLGGGPGLVAIELARANPALHGVIYDLPEPVTVARDNIEHARLTARLSVRGGDLIADGIGDGYDFVWCSSVLHFVPDIRGMLEKIRRALRTGGVLVSAHAEIPESAVAAARVLPYYLPLLMRGCHVTREGELASAMQEAGFAHVRGFEVSSFPMTPIQVLIAKAGPE
ncbi:methyltransferase [Arhodomonas sp. AD133]|uniref:methyltransferase n=1 Tax=Arhodomonas sp. AD133 TaxID=3415009 RepID=UPI003EBA3A58